MSARAAARIAVLAAIATSAVARAMPPGQDGARLRGAAEALTEVRVEDAARVIGELARRYPDDPDVRFERGMLRFYQGDYGPAAEDLRASHEAARLRAEADRQELAALVEATRDATRSFVSARSPDGRYLVRHAPGPDAILVPYAFEAMAAADRAISAELGVRVPGPIRLEIYPTAASLAQVSTLTVQEIETTGTIALCKWDRLMVTSPRALIRGYPWMDTIGHELVHLFLSRASRERAPVWLQEGVAKLLERRWRGEPVAAHLDPAAEALLHDAASHDRLLPFDRLHPSIARLPSQEDAALAFAQVATFVEGFRRAQGEQGLRDAIGRIAEGADARDALAQVAGRPFRALEDEWRRSVRARPAPAANAPRLLALRLRHGEEGDPSGQGDQSDLRDIEERARRHVRLGDLFWHRRRPAAASRARRWPAAAPSARSRRWRPSASATPSTRRRGPSRARRGSRSGSPSVRARRCARPSG